MDKEVKKFPERIGIEASKYCNLHCIKCPTGTKMNMGEKGFLELEKFEKLLDEIDGFSGTITLSSWGEAFLNPNIFYIIKAAKEKGIRVTVSSNLCHEDENFAKNIVESGIDKITIGIDGANEESYMKYRIGGNWELVMKNIDEINRIKKEKHCKTPELVWQIILNRYNENEIELARKMALERNMSFKIKPIREENIINSKESIKPSKEKFEKYFPEFENKHQKNNGINRCEEVWKRISIDWNGDVYPCCIVSNNKDRVGNVFDEGFFNIWQGETYEEIRKFLSTESYTPTKALVCLKCVERKKNMVGM